MIGLFIKESSLSSYSEYYVLVKTYDSEYDIPEDIRKEVYLCQKNAQNNKRLSNWIIKSLDNFENFHCLGCNNPEHFEDIIRFHLQIPTRESIP